MTIDVIKTQDGRAMCPLTGASFQDAEQCAQHTAAVIQRRELYAGRTLRPDELQSAPRKLDSRSPEERMAWRRAHEWREEQPERPATDKLAEMQDERYYGDAHERRESLAAFRRRSVEEMKQKMEVKPAVDTARQRAKQAAIDCLELAQFRPDVPLPFVDLARVLVDVAAKGSLVDFERFHAEFVDGLESLEREQVAQHTLAISKLQSAKVPRFTIEEPQPEAAPEPPKPSHTYYTPSRIAKEPDPAERARMERESAEYLKWKREQGEQGEPQ